MLAFWAIVIAVAFATKEDGNDANSIALAAGYDVNQLTINRRRSQALYIGNKATCVDARVVNLPGNQQKKSGTWDMCDEKSNAGPKVTKCHSDKCQSKGDPGNPFMEFAVCGTCLSQLRKMMIKSNVPGPFTRSFVLKQAPWSKRACYCYASDKGKTRSFSGDPYPHCVRPL